jgi:hypothetical protein
MGVQFTTEKGDVFSRKVKSAALQQEGELRRELETLGSSHAIEFVVSQDV